MLWEPRLEDPEIHAYILEEAGEEGLAMAAYLRDHPHVSGETILADFPDRKQSDVRKVLYRLMEAHAAEYEKDTDSKGWETFYWDLDLPEIKHIIRRRWYDELRNARRVLEAEEQTEFYACKEQHRRMLFEDAIELNFQCPVCSKPMSSVKTDREKKALKARIAELEPFFQNADPDNPIL